MVGSTDLHMILQRKARQIQMWSISRGIEEGVGIYLPDDANPRPERDGHVEMEIVERAQPLAHHAEHYLKTKPFRIQWVFSGFPANRRKLIFPFNR